ncbi:MAG: peptidylprolyl isomerase [Anaerolineales bacterium]|nr:peptidylprolyl isomerase [Anaerolineales bacterium]
MTNQTSKPKVLTKKHVARLERDRRQVQIIRTVAIAMFVLIALLIGYGILDVTYLQKQKPVAVVNGEKITVAEFQERVQMQRVNLFNTYQRYIFFQNNFGVDYSQQIQQLQSSSQFPEIIGQQIVDQLVDEALIRQEAEKLGITVSDDEVETFIQEQTYSFYPNGTPSPTATPTAFEYPTPGSVQLTLFPHTATPTEAPTSTPEPTSTPVLNPTATFTAAPPTPTFVPESVPTATPFTLDGYKAEYQKTLDQYKAYGITEATFRSVYKNLILRNKMQEKITVDVPTTAEQVHARHILVADEATAQQVLDQLKAGGDFTELAKQYSTDTGSAVNGGDLGWFTRGMMVAEFETASYTQKVGEIGQPVKSQFGYHIIQVLDRQDLPLTADQLQRNRDTAFTDWLSTILEGAKVTKNDTTWKGQIPALPTELTIQ